jgi:hypothetical protein
MNLKATNSGAAGFISRRAAQHERPDLYSPEDDRKWSILDAADVPKIILCGRRIRPDARVFANLVETSDCATISFGRPPQEALRAIQ